MCVVITGAAGLIGREIVEELSNAHRLRLIDRLPIGGASIIADLAKSRSWIHWKTRHARWMEAFRSADVVVHLAVDQRPGIPERQRLFNNTQMTWNVIEAAVQHRVSRVVFASSNWAVKALEHELAPACYLADGPKIGSDAPPRPVTPYGLSKALGELAGRMLVDQQKLPSFVAVRIGNFNAVPSTNEIVRTRWIGVQDIRGLFRRCVEAEFEGFHVVYGVSGQPSAPYDLSHTRYLLSWEPRQLP